jgi:hypothetical protein
VLVTLLTRGDGNGYVAADDVGRHRRVRSAGLGNYVSALDMAVALATAASTDAGGDAALAPVVRIAGEAGGGFEAALDALRVRRCTATSASIAVESTGRRVVYQAGSAEIGSTTADVDRARMLVRRVMPGGDGATLTLVRPTTSTSRRSSTAWRSWPRSCSGIGW